MVTSQKRIAFLGTGNMGGALIQGALNAKILKAAAIRAYDVDGQKLTALAQKTGIGKAKSHSDAVRGSDIVFLCVKPQQMRELLGTIRGEIKPAQCLVSIAAGVPIGSIEKAFAGAVRVVRAMPNTPALIGRGTTVLAQGSHAKPEDLKFARQFFSAVGEVAVLEESQFDAVTAVSGSGPAYLFYLAEALEEAALSQGLPAEAARLLSESTLRGAGAMLGGEKPPQDLRRQVTSPGGTTEAAVRLLEERQWRKIFEEAVARAKERSAQIRREFEKQTSEGGKP